MAFLLPSIENKIKGGWGLEEKELDEFIKKENLKDLTEVLKEQAYKIIEAFGSKSTLRIVAYNDQSGADSVSKEFFTSLIEAQRNLIYSLSMSNKECCVILVYEPESSLLRSYRYIFAHEYVHHFQWANAGFPFYVSKTEPPTWTPPFVTFCEIGPRVGFASIDDLLLPDFHMIIEDFIERISDQICDRLLIEKNVADDLLEYYKHEVAFQDSANGIQQAPYSIPHELKKYMRRLTLRDHAEWMALIRLIYQEDRDAIYTATLGGRFAKYLNKDYQKASEAYNELVNNYIGIDFNMFRFQDEVVKCIKKSIELLNITIETKEEW